MERTFKQSHRHPLFYMLCVGIVLTLVSYALSKSLILIVFIGFMAPFIVPYFLNYRITADGTLTGGCNIPVATIRKVVRQKDRVDVYFQVDGKPKLTFRAFYPTDKEDFISALVSLNPNIQIV